MLPVGCTCITDELGYLLVYDPLCLSPTTFGHRSKSTRKKKKVRKVK